MKDEHSQANVPADPNQALARLMEGNELYVNGNFAPPNQSVKLREELSSSQHPWAVIWGCIDSRVSPELVFNCGLGELFVIRTAGQVSDGAALGSLEFAVKNWEHYPVKVVMVLGHSACGAVKATIDSLDQSPKPAADIKDEESIHVLVEGIKPAYDWLKKDYQNNPSWAPTSDDRVTGVSMRNIAGQVEKLGKNKILKAAVDEGRITIVGAYYDLVTGKVETPIDGKKYSALRD